MGDLISRQAVIDVLGVGKTVLSRVLDDTAVVGREREKYLWGLRLIDAYINDMKELPSAQQKIIHCADCNHRNKYRFAPRYEERDYCEKHEKVVQTDWYCSWAERRQE